MVDQGEGAPPNVRLLVWVCIVHAVIGRQNRAPGVPCGSTHGRVWGKRGGWLTKGGGIGHPTTRPVPGQSDALAVCPGHLVHEGVVGGLVCQARHEEQHGQADGVG